MKKILMVIAVVLAGATPIRLLSFWEDDSCCEGGGRLYFGPQAYYGRLGVENSDSGLAGLLGLDNTDTHLDGLMYGGNGGVEYKKPWGLYAQLDFNYAQGKIKKSGALTRYLHQYDAHALAGYMMGGRECDPWAFTAYIGLGYTVQQQTLTSFHVKYRYRVCDLPIGVKWDYAFCALCSYWTVGLNVAVAPQLDSTVKVNLLRGARWTLAKRSDWVLSVPLEYYSTFCPLSLKLELFWKKIGMGGSKAVSSSGAALGLPPMKWNAYGGSLDIVWEF